MSAINCPTRSFSPPRIPPSCRDLPLLESLHLLFRLPSSYHFDPPSNLFGLYATLIPAPSVWSPCVTSLVLSCFVPQSSVNAGPSVLPEGAPKSFLPGNRTHSCSSLMKEAADSPLLPLAYSLGDADLGSRVPLIRIILSSSEPTPLPLYNLNVMSYPRSQRTMQPDKPHHPPLS